MGLVVSAHAQANVTLAWNPSTNSLVAGYNVYYGGASGVYTNKTSVGMATSLTISNLVVGTTYYFAASTYDASGAESALSSPVSYTVPTPAPGVQLAVTPTRQFALTIAGVANQSYQILASQDLKTWQVIGTVTTGTGGSATFTDTNAANYPSRFYRIH
jgi:Fibronectin type III domain